MKNFLVLSIVLFSINSLAGEVFKGSATVQQLEYNPKALYINIYGQAAKALYETASKNPDSVDYYDGGVSVVYKKDLSCTVKKTAKKTSYNCSIYLEDGKASEAPRG